MKKNEVIEILKNEGISEEVVNLAFMEKDGFLKIIFPLYISGGLVIDDPFYFLKIRWIIPKGVIIGGYVYPFKVDNCKCVGGKGMSISVLGKVGITLPTEEQVKKLGENYAKYRAVAELLGVDYHKVSAYEHPDNSEQIVHCYDFEKNEKFFQREEAPFFTVKKL